MAVMEADFFSCFQQFDAEDFGKDSGAFFGCLSQSSDFEALCAPRIQNEDVNGAVVRGEAEIPVRVADCLFAPHPFGGFRRPFSEDQEGFGSIDRFPVRLEPGADFTQGLYFVIRNRSVRFRADVQEEVAVLLTTSMRSEQLLDAFIIQILRVSPGVVGD